MKRGITVTVVEFSDRSTFQLQWRCPITGRKRTRSTGIDRSSGKDGRELATKAAGELQEKLRKKHSESGLAGGEFTLARGAVCHVELLRQFLGISGFQKAMEMGLVVRYISAEMGFVSGDDWHKFINSLPTIPPGRLLPASRDSRRELESLKVRTQLQSLDVSLGSLIKESFDG